MAALREPVRDLEGKRSTAEVINSQSMKSTGNGAPAGYDSGKKVKNFTGVPQGMR